MARSHGCYGTPTHKSWSKMVSRCRGVNDSMYPTYGGAGITVVDEWVGVGGFERFVAHIGERPSRDFSVDRIDNSRGYEPGNVRWATRGEQARNRKSTILITIGGVTKCAGDWAREHGLDPETVYARIKYGWSPVDAATKPLVRYRRGGLPA